MADFASHFISGANAGRQIRESRYRMERDEEDRQLARDYHRLQIKQLDFAGKVAQRKAAQDEFDFMQKLPAEALPAGQAGPPGPHKPIQFPAIEEAGVPAVTAQPATLEDMIAQHIAAKAAEARATDVPVPEEMAGKLGIPAGPTPAPLLTSATTLAGQTAAGVRAGDTNAARIKAAQIGAGARVQAAGIAAANKEPATVTIHTTDDDENPVTKVVTKKDALANTGGYAAPTPAAVRDKQTQAAASLEIGNDLISHIKTPEVKGVLGPIMGRFKNLEQAAGAGDPTAVQLKGEIMGFAAMQLRIHGSRAYQMAEDVKKLLNTAQTPEALTSGLNGILAASRVLAKKPGTYGKQAPGAAVIPPTGAAGAPATVPQGTPNGAVQSNNSAASPVAPMPGITHRYNRKTGQVEPVSQP